MPTGSRFIMRELTQSDVTLIAEVTRKAFSEPYYIQSGLPQSGAVSETNEEIIKDLVGGSRAFILYLDQGKDARHLRPAAIIRIRPYSPDGWLLRRFGVLPDYRGQSFGTILLNLIEKEARKVGVRRLTLYCVPERLLIPYYQRRGFRVTSIVPHAEKPLTVATMERELSGDAPSGDALSEAPEVAPGTLAVPDWDVMPGGGLYILWLYLPETRTIYIGKPGEHLFNKGIYAYIGSGSRNLPHRLRRHWTGAQHIHWQIDRLRAEAVPIGIDILPYPALESNDKGTPAPAPNATPSTIRYFSDISSPSECDLAHALSTVPGVNRFIPHFGASDCRCAGHLFHVSQDSPAYSLPRSWEQRLLCFYRDSLLPGR
ncbi:MAG: GNAT family N-acetyltransferase [Firmicutes bacterium]|nr:GNAT family N-acetyltransferase [Bacillota bacterium]